jgi:hypothetical protein
MAPEPQPGYVRVSAADQGPCHRAVTGVTAAAGLTCAVTGYGVPAGPGAALTPWGAS